MIGRVPFFLICITAGVAAGWWWSSASTALTTPPERPALISNNSATSTEAVEVSNSDSANLPRIPDENNSALTEQPYTGMPTTGVVSYYDGIMKAAPSVVSVYASMSTDSTNDTSTERNTNSQGSGVVVDADGIILTNLHLVEGLDQITVVLSDGSSYPAILIGSDRETDLAVVKISASNLPYVRLDVAPPLRVGDVVLAIGNPFGVGQTVTQGIVSATRRRIAGGSVWQHFVQIDAAINPGNSGGALINPYGQLVGVNTAVFRGDTGAVGIGFSIPADLLAQVVPQIIENGTVARGWLGVGVDELSLFPTMAAQVNQGAVILGVLENSPASQGGLQPMDVVTAINDHRISSATQLLLAISAEPPGTRVTLTVLRGINDSSPASSTHTVDIEPRELTVLLGTRPNLGVSTQAR